MSQTLIQLKTLGIPGVPAPINMLLKGSIYAAILDSVPAHLSIIIQALKSNLAAGNTCVLVTQMTPRVFLSMAEMSGVDFGGDITQSRLFVFSRKGESASNIFRHGIKRLLQEFDYFGVPKGSFFLLDQAEELFTLSDPNIAVTQARDYGEWMRSMENTSLFLFLDKGEKKTRSILNRFSGVFQINQSKTGIELLVDFWYSQDGAIAAKAFPVSLDATGLIRVDPALVQPADEAHPAGSSTDDDDTVFYFGPDFESFAASIHHSGVWIPVADFVDLVHLSRNAAHATIVIALGSHSDLQQTAKIVHYLRLERGNRLRIVIREAGFSLRYLNELLLLRFGANLIIHQQLARQQLQLLWEMLAGQTYTRKISQDFDLTHSSILSSSYKGYVDLVNFCNESLGMFERGDSLDIPLALIIANYHEGASPPEVLGQITIERNGDFFSSDAAHCYVFIHACAEENIAAALSRITGDKQASLFSEIRFITAKESIRETLLSMVQSGDIALAPDFSEAIALLNPGYQAVEAKSAITATFPALAAPLAANAAEPDPGAAETVPIEDTLGASAAAIANRNPAEHYRKSRKTQKRNRNTIILQT